MSEMKFFLRAILGGVLGIFLGENPIASGLLGSPVFLPMFIWYIFLFLTFDWLIIRFKLSDRAFFVFNAILAILIGGILDREFFLPQPQMGFLGLDLPSAVLNTLWWGTSFILLFHLVNTLLPRHKIILSPWGGVVFTLLTLMTMGGNLPAVLATVHPAGLIFLLLVIVFLSFWFFRMIKTPKPDLRPILQKNLKLSALPLLFIFLTAVFGLESYWILSAFLVVIVLLVMTRYKIAI